MKKIIMTAFIVFSVLGYLNAADPTDHDIDAQTKMIRDEIEIYQKRAQREERSAERLIFRDYTSYRQHVEAQARNELKVEELTEKLHELQKKQAEQPHTSNINHS